LPGSKYELNSILKLFRLVKTDRYPHEKEKERPALAPTLFLTDLSLLFSWKKTDQNRRERAQLRRKKRRQA